MDWNPLDPTVVATGAPAACCCYGGAHMCGDAARAQGPRTAPCTCSTRGAYPRRAGRRPGSRLCSSGTWTRCCACSGRRTRQGTSCVRAARPRARARSRRARRAAQASCGDDGTVMLWDTLAPAVRARRRGGARCSRRGASERDILRAGRPGCACVRSAPRRGWGVSPVATHSCAQRAAAQLMFTRAAGRRWVAGGCRRRSLCSCTRATGAAARPPLARPCARRWRARAPTAQRCSVAGGRGGRRSAVSDFQWHPTLPWVLASMGENTAKSGGGGVLQVRRALCCCACGGGGGGTRRPVC